MCEKSLNKDTFLSFKDEEVDVMPTAVKIISDEEIFVGKMRLYVEKLEQQARNSKEQATNDAIKALKETGVINENGSSKKKIVSWE